MDNFSILIKIFREKRGLTQAELAKKAGIGQGTIGDIERGARKCKLSTLNKISEVLKLTKEERGKLDNAFMGREILSENNDPRVASLNKKEKNQLEDFLGDTVMFFQNEDVSLEDKEKLFTSLQDAFFEIKLANKRKK